MTATDAAPSAATADVDLDAMAEGLLHTYHESSPCLGPSKINTYLSCPRKYEYQYIEQVRRPRPPAATVGSVVHAVVEHSHRAHWSPANTEDAADLLTALWNAVKAETEDPHDLQADKAMRDARDVWLPWYLIWCRGSLDIAVEETWKLPVAGSDLVLQGTIDRIYLKNGLTVVSDIKTGKRVPSGLSLANDLQLTLYSWAARQMGLTEDTLEIVAMRSQGSVMTTRTDSYIAAVLEQTVLPVHEQIMAGRFPANVSSQFGCSWCSYHTLCPVGRGS
jgi:putative RecB family exonuclease